MPINKVIQDNNTLIDLTGDTATARDVISGYTFHLANGQSATGTGEDASAKVYTATVEVTNSVGATKLVFEVEKEPVAFACVPTGSAGSYATLTSQRRILAYVYDGVNTYGSAGVQASATNYFYNTSNYLTWSYADGLLTLTTTNPQTAGVYLGNTTWVLVYI